jgi:hypothetical protein
LHGKGQSQFGNLGRFDIPITNFKHIGKFARQGECILFRSVVRLVDVIVVVVVVVVVIESRRSSSWLLLLFLIFLLASPDGIGGGGGSSYVRHDSDSSIRWIFGINSITDTDGITIQITHGVNIIIIKIIIVIIIPVIFIWWTLLYIGSATSIVF